MSKTVQWKRGNANVNSSYTGPAGEITVNTTDWSLRVHDGATVGGWVIDSNNSGNQTGNLLIVDQTITGTVANANIFLAANGTGRIYANNIIRSTGLRIGPNTNVDVTSFRITSDPLDTRISTADQTPYNGNIQITANTSYTGIFISRSSGKIGFNTGPSANVNAGYDFVMNGSVDAGVYYADPNNAGYSFAMPGGDTGLKHDVNDQGLSQLVLQHENRYVAKFVDNGSMYFDGDLTVSTGNNEPYGATFPDAPIKMFANVDSYAQVVLQNISTNNNASSDFVATADIGTDEQYFIDVGIASSTYEYPGFGVIKPNDAYILAVGANIAGPGSSSRANLILGSTTGNIKMFVGAPEDANVIAQITTAGFIPGANVTYNLGSSTRQWKDLWLSNSTMYLGGIPITVTANGQLAVNGSVISGGTGNYGNANVAAYLPTYTGNIGGNISFANGNLDLGGVQSGLFQNGQLINVKGITGLTASSGATISGFSNISAARFTNSSGENIVYNNANVAAYLPTYTGNIAANIVKNGHTWEFDDAGNLTVPGRITNNDGATIEFNTNNIRLNTVGGGAYIDIQDTSLFLLGNGSVVLGSSPLDWQFNGNGNLTLPANNSAILYPNGTSIIAGFTTPTQIVNGNSSVAVDSAGGNISFTVSGFNYGHIQYGGGVAIGATAGNLNQSANAVAIGTFAGRSSQGLNTVAIGLLAGNNSQGGSAVAVGAGAGANTQGINSVAVGVSAADLTQGNAATALGAFAGQYNQGNFAVAVGSGAAYNGQGDGAIAIGADTSPINQGDYSIAIGAVASTNAFQPANSIIIDATASQLAATGAGLFVAPVRNDVGNIGQVVTYNTSTKEFTYANTISLAGNITAGNISANVNGFAIGYRDIPQIAFTSNVTLALTDAGKHYYSANSANVITIPNNATVSFNIGTAISIVQQGSANLTVTPGSGVTLYLAGNSTVGSRTLGNYGMATLMKVASDTWFINGTGVN